MKRTTVNLLKHLNPRERSIIAADFENTYAKAKVAYIPEKFDVNSIQVVGDMNVCRGVDEMKERSRILRYTTPPSRLNRQHALGFVPTMGQLHDGHMALIEASQAECVFTAVSIFVNPTQFGANEDFDKYPRNLERDLRILSEAKVDCVYLPSTESMYPKGYKTYSYYKGADTGSEGSNRDRHFEGVSTICTKLFNIVEPNVTYVGQKDAMQCIVLGSLVRDYHINTQVRVCPVVRELDGLAMSSRNMYLSEEHRQDAVGINASLEQVNKNFCTIALTAHTEEMRLPTAKEVKEEVSELFSKNIRIGKPEYISVGSSADMRELGDDELVKKGSFLSVAVRYGSTRLLDAYRLGYDPEDYWNSSDIPEEYIIDGRNILNP